MINVAGWEPVRLAFAWTEAAQVPLILGQTTFFQTFDLRVRRSQQTIEISCFQ